MKTIQAYPFNNTSSGIIGLDIENRPIKCWHIPRKMLNETKAKSGDALQLPSLYFLLGENKRLYIGQTGDFSDRKGDLDKKDFWDEVLIFSSLKPQELNLGYLEYLAITDAKKSKCL